jgi:hypothetical protein
MSETQSIGEIGNCYGGLEVKEEDGRYFWSIENCDGHYWEEIPEYLFLDLHRFEGERVHDSNTELLRAERGRVE